MFPVIDLIQLVPIDLVPHIHVKNTFCSVCLALTEVGISGGTKKEVSQELWTTRPRQGELAD